MIEYSPITPETSSRSRRLLRKVGRTAATSAAILAASAAASPARPLKAAASSREAGRNINTLVHDKAVGMAKEIVHLGRTKPPRVEVSVLRPDDNFVDEVYVQSFSKTVGETVGSKGGYQLFADIPAPPAGHYHNNARKLNPHELKLVDPNETQQIVLDEGQTTQLILEENTAEHTWSFEGHYVMDANHDFRAISASTSPTAKGSHRLTAAKLELVTTQAQQMITDAKNHQPTTYLDPAF